MEIITELPKLYDALKYYDEKYRDVWLKAEKNFKFPANLDKSESSGYSGYLSPVYLIQNLPVMIMPPNYDAIFPYKDKFYIVSRKMGEASIYFRDENDEMHKIVEESGQSMFIAMPELKNHILYLQEHLLSIVVKTDSLITRQQKKDEKTEKIRKEFEKMTANPSKWSLEDVE